MIWIDKDFQQELDLEKEQEQQEMSYLHQDETPSWMWPDEDPAHQDWSNRKTLKQMRMELDNMDLL